jgi:hypothetical protein
MQCFNDSSDDFKFYVGTPDFQIQIHMSKQKSIFHLVSLFLKMVFTTEHNTL